MCSLFFCGLGVAGSNPVVPTIYAVEMPHKAPLRNVALPILSIWTKLTSALHLWGVSR